MANNAIDTDEPLPQLLGDVFGSWLPGLLFYKTGIARTVMERSTFRSWLNYVVLQVNSTHESTRSIINECLLYEGIADVTSMLWESRRTFNVGHW